jgi:hypothetical protein
LKEVYSPFQAGQLEKFEKKVSNLSYKGGTVKSFSGWITSQILSKNLSGL